MNTIKCRFPTLFFIFLVTALSCVQKAQGMLPVAHDRQATVAAHRPATQRHGRLLTVAAAIQTRLTGLLGRDINPDDRYVSVTEGVVSFACSMLSLVCFGALALTAAPFFIAPAILFGGLAVVLGAIGIRHAKPGYAIAGLTLGIIEIAGALLALALIL